ncbi:MAG: hypothetical protein WBI99_04355 [Limnochordia bacterium]|nr:hypothetical protein [Limnochordia bacterium]HOK32374.1 hypothetical protein [Limnochordia bacterium]HOM00918.1 hypothetical protein [Limnochordia bacterium]HOQ74776.1 hypothetical protein [Limnochordia bacterium]HPP73107.1 hypothetical protein [Limnochordia bacterium]
MWRSCRLRNMYARNARTRRWESWNRYHISTMYIPVLDHTDSFFGSVWDYVF